MGLCFSVCLTSCILEPSLYRNSTTVLLGKISLSDEVSKDREREAGGSYQNKSVMRNCAVCGVTILAMATLFSVTAWDQFLEPAPTVAVRFVMLVVGIGLSSLTVWWVYLADSIRDEGYEGG